MADSDGWTVQKVVIVFMLFLTAGLCEIAGGWLIWKNVRGGKPYWWSIIGAVILVLYGFVPTLQPLDDFGRVYAVYGGIFIALSFAWSAVLDGFRPDTGDLIGSFVALIGVCICLFWPRTEDSGEILGTSDSVSMEPT